MTKLLGVSVKPMDIRSTNNSNIQHSALAEALYRGRTKRRSFQLQLIVAFTESWYTLVHWVPEFGVPALGQQEPWKPLLQLLALNIAAPVAHAKFARKRPPLPDVRISKQTRLKINPLRMTLRWA